MVDQLERRLARVEERLDELEKILGRGTPSVKQSLPEFSPSVKEVLNLPGALRKTVLALQTLGEATSVEIAGKTGRTGSVEKGYLDELNRLGYATNINKGKKTYYKLSRYY